MAPIDPLEACPEKDAGFEDECRSRQGSFVPGVKVLAGGAAKEVRPPTAAPASGTVLFQSSAPDMQPDMKDQLAIKEGTEDERRGRVGSFQAGRTPYARDSGTAVVKVKQYPPRTVLEQCPNLVASEVHGGATNIKGGRPEERHGTIGGFSSGVRILQGGAPKFVPLKSAAPDNKGTVLSQSQDPHMQPDASVLAAEKAGAEGERLGRSGSSCTAAHLRVHASPDWLEVKPASRRHGPGHFAAGGATILSGGNVPPRYDTAARGLSPVSAAGEEQCDDDMQ